MTAYRVGKSTLAFDLVFARSRRYLGLSTVCATVRAAGIAPDVDAIYCIRPPSRRKRTAAAGRRARSDAEDTILSASAVLQADPSRPMRAAIEPHAMRSLRGAPEPWPQDRVLARSSSRQGYYTALAKCAAGKGMRSSLRRQRLPPAFAAALRFSRAHDRAAAEASRFAATEGELRGALQRALDHGKGVAHLLEPAPKRGPPRMRVFSTRRACPGCGRSFPEPDSRLFSYNSKHGWCEACFGTGLAIDGFDAEQSGEELWWNEWFAGEATPCASCEGQRLNPVALTVRFREHSIAELAALPVESAREFFDGLALRGRRPNRARLLAEIAHGLFSHDVVRLPRPRPRAPTLSCWGRRGPLRRARFEPRGVCITRRTHDGLHPRDNSILLDALASCAPSATR